MESVHHTPGAAPELTGHEKKKADEEENLNANTTYEVIRREGEQELSRTSSALAWSALAAGLSMGFSMLAEALLHQHLPESAAPDCRALEYSMPIMRKWKSEVLVL